MLHQLLHTFLENLKLFPVLFITYIFLEYIEHKTNERTTALIQKSKNSGPFFGSLLGALPQCGFSVIASNLFAAKIITMGTLIAIFLSTSDEMLPILISNNVTTSLICKILGYKIICGIIFGYIIDYFANKYFLLASQNINIEALCENENCHCESGILKPAFLHSIHIWFFILIFSSILNGILYYLPQKSVISFLQIPLLGELFSGLLGLIPNCSSSVILTQLYLENYINLSTLLTGSLVSGGIGILVLFKVNKSIKQNILIIILLYSCGILGGLTSNLIY